MAARQQSIRQSISPQLGGASSPSSLPQSEFKVTSRAGLPAGHAAMLQVFIIDCRSSSGVGGFHEVDLTLSDSSVGADDTIDYSSSHASRMVDKRKQAEHVYQRIIEHVVDSYLQGKEPRAQVDLDRVFKLKQGDGLDDEITRQLASEGSDLSFMREPAVALRALVEEHATIIGEYVKLREEIGHEIATQLELAPKIARSGQALMANIEGNVSKFRGRPDWQANAADCNRLLKAAIEHLGAIKNAQSRLMSSAAGEIDFEYAEFRLEDVARQLKIMDDARRNLLAITGQIGNIVGE